MGLPATIDGDYAVVDEQETGLAVYEGGGLGVSSAELRQMVGQDEERREIIKSYISRNLRSGVDYGIIPMTGRNNTKPSLYKPGAEKVCMLLGLVATFAPDHDTLAMAGMKVGLFAFVCRLTRRNGEIVAEGRGTYDIAERSGQNVNGAVKMAQKRAHVDATLRVAALSEIFTQDAPGEDGATTQQSSAPRLQAVPNGPVQAVAPQDRPQAGPGPATEKQVKAVFAIAYNIHKIKDEQTKEIVRSIYHCKVDELTKAQASEFIEQIKDESWQAPNLSVEQPAPRQQPTVQVFVGGEVDHALEVQKVQEIKRRITNKLRGFKFDDERILNFIAASLRGKKPENRTLADYEYVEGFLTWLDNLTRTDAAAKAMGTWIKQYEDTLDPLFPNEEAEEI